MCEGLSICRRSERDSIGTRRERLCATVQVANAEIQPGNYFGLFDRVDNIPRLVGFFIVKRTIAFFSGMYRYCLLERDNPRPETALGTGSKAEQGLWRASVETRSRAIRRRTSKEGANLGNFF